MKVGSSNYDSFGVRFGENKPLLITKATIQTKIKSKTHLKNFILLLLAVVARKLPEWAKPADVCEKMQKMGTGTPVQKITGFEIVLSPANRTQKCGYFKFEK